MNMRLVLGKLPGAKGTEGALKCSAAAQRRLAPGVGGGLRFHREAQSRSEGFAKWSCQREQPGQKPRGSRQEYRGLPRTLPILPLKVSNPGKLLNPSQTKTVGHSTMG